MFIHCVHVYVWICVHVRVQCVQVQRIASSVVSQHHQLFPLRQELSCPGTLSWLGWLASEPQGPPSASAALGLPAYATAPSFLNVGSGEQT